MVSDPAYVPERGHIVWLNFTPHAGHEQGGRRPALVLTPASYNGLTGLMIAVPVTSRVKGYPFEVALPTGGAVQGVVLSDQARSLDWRARRAEYGVDVPEEVLDEVGGKLAALLHLG
ncbi:ppGpp-regulated growth inhibitor ChpA/MazF [Deinococcus phoenicis]|uniref:PpGpp-regulated growth inhibitor ChpA/MazF n=1 Tax=Deinococcus phoenicis TaxID=1476583 RepID=A0A016QQJ2_9DEIO|nr:endoribonuclease MazF [Deinococcus phoenicis]EYB68353.1 ppGpp-regulated growth inhibitor ChpA/MazF [Deinococcus phoenicis]